MNSSPSRFDAGTAFDRLHPEIRRWIRNQGWSSLRDLQVQTIEKIFGGEADLIVDASTAAGKTEAAFLPALTLSCAGRRGEGLSILYISPLKALINDQFRRLEELCDKLEMPIVRWHGDAPSTQKKRTLANPSGVALITPESIEALFLRRPTDARRLFGKLAFIIIDELHAFLGNPRGIHLASLLKRIDALGTKPARRLALSATIGDFTVACAWLRPNRPENVERISGDGGEKELQLQIRGYRIAKVAEAPASESAAPDSDDEPDASPFAAIVDHLFRTLRGKNNLVFAGARQSVEIIADGLRRRCEEAVVPNEFFPHHGSLAKDPRETLEQRLLAGDPPTTAICTSTLELGVDIGSVESVAQIGAPRSLAGLRQRLGRCGRRAGKPAILRIYVTEEALDAKSSLIERLRLETVRAVASIKLLLDRFKETPLVSKALGTGLLHQTLSIIVERGGARADGLFRMLAGPGPFEKTTPAEFGDLLRHVAGPPFELIEQAPDGVLMLGSGGENLTTSREFFSLFTTGEEWRLVVDGSTLGTLPISNPVVVDMLIIFAGRRWRIADIEEKSKTLRVVAHPGGRPPKFDGQGHEQIADELAEQMRRTYGANETPAFLDATARDLLSEGRAIYRELRLDQRRVFAEDGDAYVFFWRGGAVTSALAVALAGLGLAASVHDFGLAVNDVDDHALRDALRKIQTFSSDDLRGLAGAVANLESEKFDRFVPRSMLERNWTARNWKSLVALPSLIKEMLEVG